MGHVDPLHGKDSRPRSHGDYFATDAARARYVLAAHYMKRCDHVVEIGGGGNPITNFMTTTPESILVVDPKISEYHAETLRGEPCRVDHVRSTFQAQEFDLRDRTFGLVILGLSLKHFGDAGPEEAGSWRKFILMVNAARVTVMEFACAWDLGRRQADTVLRQAAVGITMRLDMDWGDNHGVPTAFARRRFLVLEPWPH